MRAYTLAIRVDCDRRSDFASVSLVHPSMHACISFHFSFWLLVMLASSRNSNYGSIHVVNTAGRRRSQPGSQGTPTTHEVPPCRLSPADTRAPGRWPSLEGVTVRHGHTCCFATPCTDN